MCFIAQQVAEKALKAIAFRNEYEIVKSHSIVQIAKSLKLNGQIEEYGKVLDLYYISTRYPDALPDNAIPSDSFSRKQASAALKMASHFIQKAKIELSKRS